MKRKFRLPRPGAVLGVVAIVIALAGTAFAAGNLKIGAFEPSSRDRLAGTGVIQYATASHNTGAIDAAKPKAFAVQCELSKKLTSGGFRWTGPTPPDPADYEIVDATPSVVPGGQFGGQGKYEVRIWVTGATAANQPLSVVANCVKSRSQRGTPPAF